MRERALLKLGFVCTRRTLDYGDYGDPAKMTGSRIDFVDRPFVSLKRADSLVNVVRRPPHATGPTLPCDASETCVM